MNSIDIINPDIWRISDEKYEKTFFQTPIEVNTGILACIENGTPEILDELFDEHTFEYFRSIFLENESYGEIMSFNCGAAFAFSVKGGLPFERASAVSSKFINASKECSSVDELVLIHHDMFIEFANEVKKAKKSLTGNIAVDTAVYYIENHVNEKMRISDIADYCFLSISRLQHLFSKTMGISISEYIRKQKIKKACFLLSYTPLNSTKIAEKLSYASQSHFIDQFRKETGVTPIEYRKQYPYTSNR